MLWLTPIETVAAGRAVEIAVTDSLFVLDSVTTNLFSVCDTHSHQMMETPATVHWEASVLGK